jgi:hypothetical protein
LRPRIIGRLKSGRSKTGKPLDPTGRVSKIMLTVMTLLTLLTPI